MIRAEKIAILALARSITELNETNETFCNCLRDLAIAEVVKDLDFKKEKIRSGWYNPQKIGYSTKLQSKPININIRNKLRRHKRKPVFVEL